MIGNASSILFCQLAAPTGVTASDAVYLCKVNITWNSVTGASHYIVFANNSNSSATSVAISGWIISRSFDLDFNTTGGSDFIQTHYPQDNVHLYFWVKAANSSMGANASSFSIGDAGSVTNWDNDKDGIIGCFDNCLTVTNSNQSDLDKDSKGDACDNCPAIANSSQEDMDNDGKGNVCDNCPRASNADQADGDSDGVGNSCDNCPSTSNANQFDGDNDLIGNSCDNCPNTANLTQTDLDRDQKGDACDNCPAIANSAQEDMDNDGKGNVCDNCPRISNINQEDCDKDGFGDLCDNCPNIINPDQTDSDSDGTGDACEMTNINEVLYSEIRIFPNPAYEKLSVIVPLNLKLSKLRVISINGQTIISVDTRSSVNEIDLTTLRSGLYILEVTGEYKYYKYFEKHK